MHCELDLGSLEEDDLKKKTTTFSTVEDSQQAASQAAQQFGLFECDRCGKEIVKKLGRGIAASFERLRTSDHSDIIGLAQEGIQFSTNGIHLVVRIGDKIIDNLHPEGVPAGEWAGKFMTATGAPLVHQSMPVSEFFGKIFRVKLFNQWLFGSYPTWEDRTMGAILDMIQKIRERPGLILGRPSASTLYAFLSGFAYARKDSDSSDYDFLAGFNQWVHDRYQITSSQGWAKIIEFYSMTEADEMKLVWKLLDEYLASRASGRKRVS